VVKKRANFDQPFALHTIVKQNNEILNLLFGSKKRYRSQHVPYACKKSMMLYLDEFLKSIPVDKKTLYEYSGSYKFRNIKSIARYSFFKKYWDIYMYKCIEKKYSLCTIIINDKKDMKEEIDKVIQKNGYQFLIIHNEVQSLNQMAISNYEYLRKVLYQKFPEKSSYEKF
jgi:hypothetical protein